jgi:hypothetical protein
MEKESKLKGMIEVSKGVWNGIKLVSPTLVITGISSGFMYKCTNKNLAVTMLIGGICGLGTAAIHYIIRHDGINGIEY